MDKKVETREINSPIITSLNTHLLYETRLVVFKVDSLNRTVFLSNLFAEHLVPFRWDAICPLLVVSGFVVDVGSLFYSDPIPPSLSTPTTLT